MIVVVVVVCFGRETYGKSCRRDDQVFYLIERSIFCHAKKITFFIRNEGVSDLVCVLSQRENREFFSFCRWDFFEYKSCISTFRICFQTDVERKCTLFLAFKLSRLMLFQFSTKLVV